MAITITKDLPALIATRNDAWMEAETDQTAAKIKVEVFNASTSPVATFTMPCDANKKVLFNLKRILEAIGEPTSIIGPDLPAFNQAIVTACTVNSKVFYLHLTDIIISTGVVVSTLNSSNYRCLLAGSGFEFFTDSYLLSRIGTGASLRRFLSQAPLTKKITKSQQFYLYYYHSDTHFNTGVEVQAKIYYDDGGFPEEITKFSIAPTAGQLLLIPAGYDQLNLAANATTRGASILKYEVYLYATLPAPGAFTERRTFEVADVCGDVKYFLFLNSLGGIDSLFTRVVDEYGMETSAENGERNTPHNYNVTTGQFFEFSKQSMRTQKVITDLLLLTERLYMRDFFASPNVWEAIGGKFLPVKIKNDSIALSKGNSAYQSVQFAYNYQFNDIAYTQ